MPVDQEQGKPRDSQERSPCRIVPCTTNPLRFSFQYNGTSVYEFEQSLLEVTLYVPAPPQPIVCNITANHIQLGLKGGSQYFLDEDTFATIDSGDSTWCYEDNDSRNGQRQIVIYLQKAAKGLVWERALQSKHGEASIDPVSLQQVQKQIMIERWTEENPGMDFRDAEFNGSIPDPRTFMGGVGYS